MNSPTHRANILNGNFTEIGIATAKGVYQGRETVFVVQMFGTAAIPAPVVAVSAPISVPSAPLAIATDRTVQNITLESAVRGLPLVAGETTDALNVTEAASNTVESTLAEPISAVEAISNRRDVEPSTEVIVGATEAAPADFAEEAQVVMGAAEAISLYSGLAASSTNLTPAPYATVDLKNSSVSKMAVLATEPSELLQLIYLILGGITALVLLLSVVLEWRHHRPVQTAYGLLLLMVMAGLFYLHTTIIAGAVVF
jgi:hypothetical protein